MRGYKSDIRVEYVAFGPRRIYHVYRFGRTINGIRVKTLIGTFIDNELPEERKRLSRREGLRY